MSEPDDTTDDWGEDEYDAEPTVPGASTPGTAETTEPADEASGQNSPNPQPRESSGDEDDADAGQDSAGDQAPPLYYGSTDEFLREYLRHMYRRPINGRSRVWAARWWEHDEAVARLEALWRAWEHLRQDASTGASVWWRDHADHHMATLMDPDGPFAAADPSDLTNQCSRGEPLPYEKPPDDLFPDVRAAVPSTADAPRSHDGEQREPSPQNP